MGPANREPDKSDDSGECRSGWGERKMGEIRERIKVKDGSFCANGDARSPEKGTDPRSETRLTKRSSASDADLTLAMSLDLRKKNIKKLNADHCCDITPNPIRSRTGNSFLFLLEVTSHHRSLLTKNYTPSPEAFRSTYVRIGWLGASMRRLPSCGTDASFLGDLTIT